jgi:RNA polymerase sigma factor (sigma-70 family)
MSKGEINQPEPVACFDQVYTTHQQALHAFFFARTNDAEVALELLQEAFLRAWRNCHVLQGMPGNEQRYWLFAVAKNLLTDYYRKQAVQASAFAQLTHEPLWTGQPLPDLTAQVETREQFQQLDYAIQQLPEELRTVLLLQTLGELTSRQIGEMLDKPAGTVRYQIAQARQQLAERLKLAETLALELEKQP